MEPEETKRVRLLCGDYEVIIEVKPKAYVKPPEVKLGFKAALILDQTHKGYAQTIERYTANNVEIHEILGSGLTNSVKVSDRIYRHPALDDYDVLRTIENLARRSSATLFITGDKTLSEEAKFLRTTKGLNVEVYYMPPSDYLGKEAVIQAIMDILKKLPSP